MARRTFYSRSVGGSNRFRRPLGASRQSDFSKYIHKAVSQEIIEEEHILKPFTDLPIHQELLANISKRGFVNMTPIQEKAITPIMQGEDVIGIAQTGTGKTGAFLIPLIHAITLNPNKRVLIVVPTRELAQQIYQEMRDFAGQMRVYATAIIGGANMYRQIQQLRRNPHFVIGTPGRLKDLIERRELNLSTFDTVVLDEVDRMLDMGFIQDIRFLISFLPEKKQSLFFSATLSPIINSLIRTISKNPRSVSIDSVRRTANVDQDIVRVEAGKDKIDVLHDILIQPDVKKTLIFGRTKRSVDRLSRNLESRGFKVTCIHGDKTQYRRNQAIDQFKLDTVNILVATDVASRGIDIDDVTHVINYELPETYEDYIHRIGRTGRANKTGKALTFIE
ncbi:DEAD/DEAH box helicase [Candidatus Woesebacteria bacterium]|nr:DEAD/DEAH box helicase [Candidatus Woesebacteria bacterium]